MSVIPEFCLSYVLYKWFPAYHNLCRGLKYLSKIRYTTLVMSNVAGFLIFETVFSYRLATLPYILKKYHKNERHLRLVTHIFTKLSQNMCLINTHIFMYQHTRRDYKLWKALWFHWVFSYIFDDHSCLNCCISTKLSLIVCLINCDISKCQM